MSNESIERFNSYVPDMHGQGMGICHAADGEYVRYSDHERDVLFQIKIARDQALCDAVKEVERLYDEWWDIDRRRWLNVVLERLRALSTQAEDREALAPRNTGGK